MKHFSMILILLFFISVIPAVSSDIDKSDFAKVEQWDHGEHVFSSLSDSVIDDDGHLFAGYMDGENGFFLTTPEKRINFGPRGEGPSDIFLLNFACEYKGDIAVLENMMVGRMKVFTKKNGTYVWKATKWFKKGNHSQFTNDGIFMDGKWFFAGYGQVNTGAKFYLKPFDIFYVRVYDDNGKPLKTLLKGRVGGQTRYNQKYFFLDDYEGKVFFAAEDELELKVICPKELKVIKEINLEKPSFYKRMPAEFYQYIDNKGNPLNTKRMIEHWKISYSSITKMLVEGDQLVIQIRTCSDKLKRFALLFYDAATFKLQKTVYIDDHLLAAKNGKYYFFANGDPWFDEEAVYCIINIYSFKEKHYALLAVPEKMNPCALIGCPNLGI